MQRFKDCPSCGFRAALRARTCARCNHPFDDVPPLSVRNEIMARARRQRDEFPRASRGELEEKLLLSIMEDPRLLDAAHFPHEGPEGLVDEVLGWLRHAARALGLVEDSARFRLRVAVEAAVDELLSREEN